MTVDVHLTWCEKLTSKSKGLDPVSKNLWQFFLFVFGEMPIILLHISSLHLRHKKNKTHTQEGGGGGGGVAWLIRGVGANNKPQ